MREKSIPFMPYKGLIPYSEEDSPFFFGREREREIITANLMASQLTLLYGASGVGKSSVLRAGVSYQLRQVIKQNLAKHGAPDFVIVLFSSWRDDPVMGLKTRVRDSITQILNVEGLEPPSVQEGLADTLQSWTEKIRGDLLIILDQFEEYFLYHGHEAEEGTFDSEFPRMVNRSDLRVHFLISIREDSLAKLDRFKGRIPKLFGNYLRIEHLGREAARAAIEKPIEQYNRLQAEPGQQIEIESPLIETVLEQVRPGDVIFGEGGRGVIKGGKVEPRIESPLLQLVMTRLWNEEMNGGSRKLRLPTLQKLGGAAGVVQTHLEDSMRKLTDEEKNVAAHVFHYLVTPSGTKIAQTMPDLAGYAKLSEGELLPVLQKLSGGDVRILRPVDPPPGQPSATRYEIFHDVLSQAVLSWQREFVEAQAQERIRREEQERGEQKEREMRARRMRQALIAMAVILAVMATLVYFAFQQRQEAVYALQRADEERAKVAKAEMLAQQRLGRIKDGILLKQAALSGDLNKIRAELDPSLFQTPIVFRATQKSLNYTDALGRPIYRFELFPDMSSIPDGPGSIALITYKMDHPTFKNTLLATGPEREFRASYDGWGCLTRVIAVIEYTDPDRAPTITTFNMCENIV